MFRNQKVGAIRYVKRKTKEELVRIMLRVVERRREQLVPSGHQLLPDDLRTNLTTFKTAVPKS